MSDTGPRPRLRSDNRERRSLMPAMKENDSQSVFDAPLNLSRKNSSDSLPETHGLLVKNKAVHVSLMTIESPKSSSVGSPLQGQLESHPGSMEEKGDSDYCSDNSREMWQNMTSVV